MVRLLACLQLAEMQPNNRIGGPPNSNTRAAARALNMAGWPPTRRRDSMSRRLVGTLVGLEAGIYRIYETRWHGRHVYIWGKVLHVQVRAWYHVGSGMLENMQLQSFSPFCRRKCTHVFPRLRAEGRKQPRCNTIICRRQTFWPEVPKWILFLKILTSTQPKCVCNHTQNLSSIAKLGSDGSITKIWPSQKWVPPPCQLGIHHLATTLASCHAAAIPPLFLNEIAQPFAPFSCKPLPSGSWKSVGTP